MITSLTSYIIQYAFSGNADGLIRLPLSFINSTLCPAGQIPVFCGWVSRLEFVGTFLSQIILFHGMVSWSRLTRPGNILRNRYEKVTISSVSGSWDTIGARPQEPRQSSCPPTRVTVLTSILRDSIICTRAARVPWEPEAGSQQRAKGLVMAVRLDNS